MRLNSVAGGRVHKIDIVFENDQRKKWSSYCRYDDAYHDECLQKKRSATCPPTDGAEVRSKSRVTALLVTASINFG